MSERAAAPFDRRAVSKALSQIAAASVADVLAAETQSSGKTRVIGITGAPGAGKSTLIGRLAAHRLRQAASLAVIAIDPTSPRSHGSLLGDRIRMDELSEDPRVFIRSLASRTSQDGLTDNLAEIITALEGFDFEEVIIETVGVGQASYSVRVLSDVEVLVLTPGGGDYVQAMKAGIMETADIYVVNKADQPGADRLVAEITNVLRLAAYEPAPPVIQVQAINDAGVAELSAALDRCVLQQGDSADEQHRRRARQRYRVAKLVQRRLEESLDTLPEGVWDESIQHAYRCALDALCIPDGGRAAARIS
jgi:LAO/AO transport system kinase